MGGDPIQCKGSKLRTWKMGPFVYLFVNWIGHCHKFHAPMIIWITVHNLIFSKKKKLFIIFNKKKIFHNLMGMTTIVRLHILFCISFFSMKLSFSTRIAYALKPSLFSVFLLHLLFLEKLGKKKVKPHGFSLVCIENQAIYNMFLLWVYQSQNPQSLLLWVIKLNFKIILCSFIFLYIGFLLLKIIP